MKAQMWKSQNSELQPTATVSHSLIYTNDPPPQKKKNEDFALLFFMLQQEASIPRSVCL